MQRLSRDQGNSGHRADIGKVSLLTQSGHPPLSRITKNYEMSGQRVVVNWLQALDLTHLFFGLARLRFDFTIILFRAAPLRIFRVTKHYAPRLIQASPL
jgi:hypothetical protein